jgi:hypothetical protein
MLTLLIFAGLVGGVAVAGVLALPMIAAYGVIREQYRDDRR